MSFTETPHSCAHVTKGSRRVNVGNSFGSADMVRLLHILMHKNDLTAMQWCVLLGKENGFETTLIFVYWRTIGSKSMNELSKNMKIEDLFSSALQSGIEAEKRHLGIKRFVCGGPVRQIMKATNCGSGYLETLHCYFTTKSSPPASCWLLL